MRAYVGTPDGPVLRGVDDPVPAPGEAVVAVEAFSVNRGELGLFRRRAEGWRPGQDIAGRVLVPAADGSGPSAGARVAGMVDVGGWAERVAAPAGRLAVLPDGTGTAAAATLGVAGLTALRALRQGGPLLGREVLVTGATGGVGTFAIQLAAAAGATVTALAGRRPVDLRALGAARVLDRLEPPAAGDPSQPADDGDGPRYDLVLESIGGPVLAAALRQLTHAGHLVVLGTSSREQAPLSISAFRPHTAATVHGFWVYGSGEPYGPDLGVLARLVADGALAPVIGHEDDWTRLPDALRRLGDRAVPGKTVLHVPS